MAPKGILDLPAELLDRIYSYLDWNRTTDLIPERPDIRRISLTCKHLRESIIPLLFRNVTLCLRWVDGALTEPSLFPLRRHRPDLAQHIRCVYISTKVGRLEYWPNPEESQHARPLFSVPEDVEDWLNPELAVWPDSRHYAELNAAHRERVDAVVGELFKGVSESYEMAMDAGSGTAEAMVCQMVAQTSYASRKQKEALDGARASGAPLFSRPVQRRRTEQQIGSGAGSGADQADDDPSPAMAWRMRSADQHLKQQTDALATVMLCLPATVIELIFEACVHGPDKSPQNQYAMHVAAASIQVFAGRLESLTAVVSNHLRPRPNLRHPNGNLMGTVETADAKTVTPEVIAGLTGLKNLVLASTVDAQGIFHFGGLQRDSPNLERWHALPAIHNLASLDFWNMHISDEDAEKLVKAIPHFHAVQRIGLKNICLSTRSVAARLNPNNVASREVAWLRFLIALRRVMPGAVIELGNPHCEVSQTRGLLSQSAVSWLVVEAVPAGSIVDHQREERLFEDFESFLPLWEAEDSFRGSQAAEERKSGELVDAAMCSRWKQFANVRRDQGEWMTI
ncbi:hypothetical protein LTR85_009848 [Meristemomyces frigidus]|nr:hypothetical protein LTR85_009848 [Meristemomyces frigidus]